MAAASFQSSDMLSCQLTAGITGPPDKMLLRCRSKPSPRLTRADIEAGKSIHLAAFGELGSIFGLLTSVEHGDLCKAWDAGFGAFMSAETDRAGVTQIATSLGFTHIGWFAIITEELWRKCLADVRSCKRMQLWKSNFGSP